MPLVKRIDFIHYKKIKAESMNFEPGLNVISGGNGTCKTSILHIISNSYKEVKSNAQFLKDPSCLRLIKDTNSILNAKVERLNKGDKQRADPAPGTKGALFEVFYDNGLSLRFRRHNSDGDCRYSLRPYYPSDVKESLPKMPVIYLSIKRLYPLGEYDDKSIKQMNTDLPDEYLRELRVLYRKYTGINVIGAIPQNMGSVKIRSDFNTDTECVDSNTISAGEDNLYIILHALMSLRYYHDCIESDDEVQSVLLLDELDATLHPSIQLCLIELFQDYGKKFGIQTVVTTHSLSAIEYALKKGINVLYLIDNENRVHIKDDYSIVDIEMRLRNKSKIDYPVKRAINVFMEDDEARLFFTLLMKRRPNKAYQFFNTPNINIGCGELSKMFKDEQLKENFKGCFCILDGDSTNLRNYGNRTICLPGQYAPD